MQSHSPLYADQAALQLMAPTTKYEYMFEAVSATKRCLNHFRTGHAHPQTNLNGLSPNIAPHGAPAAAAASFFAHAFSMLSTLPFASKQIPPARHAWKQLMARACWLRPLLIWILLENDLLLQPCKTLQGFTLLLLSTKQPLQIGKYCGKTLTAFALNHIVFKHLCPWTPAISHEWVFRTDPMAP